MPLGDGKSETRYDNDDNDDDDDDDDVMPQGDRKSVSRLKLVATRELCWRCSRAAVSCMRALTPSYLEPKLLPTKERRRRTLGSISIPACVCRSKG